MVYENNILGDIEIVLNLNNCIFERVIAPIENMILNYKLYLNFEVEEPEGFQDVFSLSIAMTHGEKSKQVHFKDISRSKEVALEVVEILVNGEVDTYSAPYIIEELLDIPRFILRRV